MATLRREQRDIVPVASENKHSHPEPLGLFPGTPELRLNTFGQSGGTMAVNIVLPLADVHTYTEYASGSSSQKHWPSCHTACSSASQPSRSTQCQNTPEITRIAVISQSQSEVIPIRAAEAQSTLLQTRLGSPGRIAQYLTPKFWRLALRRLLRVLRMRQRLTFSYMLQKS